MGKSTSHRDISVGSIRPLVRYVDEDQAVIDTHIVISPRVPTRSAPPAPEIIECFIEIDGEDGFHDEQVVPLTLEALHGACRIEMVSPRRWWPAGMGEQALYTLTLSLILRDEVIDKVHRPVGLTSVRRRQRADGDLSVLLVNGQEFAINSVLPLDRVKESSLLPVGGATLVVVRDHYGPDVLYEAADRAGVLLIQCVPIHPNAEPEAQMAQEVTRLAAHPSLAGWCVGHYGQCSLEMAQRLQRLDPTHAVFTDVPHGWAA